MKPKKRNTVVTKHQPQKIGSEPLRKRLTGKSPGMAAKLPESDDESMDFDENLGCDVCEQPFGSIDVHSLTREKIRWRGFNVSKVTGRKKATVRQCYPCFAWARSKKMTTIQQAANHVKPNNTKDEGKWTAMMSERRDWMAGKGWSKFDEADEVKNQVAESDGKFGEEFGEGYFYKLVDYIKLIEPDLDVRGWATNDILGFMRKHHSDVQVVIDRFGNAGVKESTLPQGASYKYREGARYATDFRRVGAWEDVAEAAEAFDEVAEKKHGSVLALAEEELAFPGDNSEEVNAESSVPGSAPSTHDLPPQPAECVAIAHRQIVKPSPAGRRGQALTSLVSGPSLSSRAPSDAEATTTASSSSGRAVKPLSAPGTETGRDKSDVEATAQEQDLSVSRLMALLRSSCPQKVAAAARDLLTLSLKNNSFAKMWSGGLKSRDINSRMDGLKAAASKISRLGASEDTDQSADPMSILATKLLQESDRLKVSSDFISMAKGNQLQLITTTLSEKALAIINSQTAAAVFSAISTGAVARVQVPSCEPFDNCLQVGVQLVRFAMSHTNDDSRLHLGLAPASNRPNIQHHFIADFTEKLFKGTVSFFKAMIFELVRNDLVPCLEHNYFTETPWRFTGFGFWTPQAEVDWSAVVIMASAAQHGHAVAQPALATTVKRLVENLESVSVHIRAFDGKKSPDGTGDVGRWCLKVIEKIAGQGGDTNSLVEVVKKDLPKALHLCHADFSAFQGIETLAEWLATDGTLQVILGLVTAVSRLAGLRSEDSDVAEAQKWVENLFEYVKQTNESHILDGLSGASLDFLMYHATPIDPSAGEEVEESEEVSCFNLVVSVFQFYADILAAKADNVAGHTVILEMRERIAIVQGAFAARVPSSEAERTSQLRAWSAVYGRQLTVRSSELTLSDQPNLMRALASLRAVLVATSVTTFVTEELTKTYRHHDPKEQPPTELLEWAFQNKGVLPPECGSIIDEAKAWNRCSAIVARLRQQDNVTNIDVASAFSDASKFLKNITHGFKANVVFITDYLGDAWKKEKELFVDTNKGVFEWEKLHTKFSKVIAAGETGNFEEVPWIHDADDKGVVIETQIYLDCFTKAVTTARIAHSLSTLLKACGAVEDEKVMRDIAERADAIQRVKDISKVLGTMALGNMLLQKTRGPSFKQDLETLAAAMKKSFKFKIESLPKHFKQLHKEATSDSKGVDSKSTPVGAPPAAPAAAPVANESTTSGATEPAAKKQKLLAAAAKLLKKNRGAQ